MPQDLSLYELLSIKEIMKYYGKLYGMTAEEIEEKFKFLQDLLKLPGDGSSYIRKLSGGQKRRVSLVGLDPLVRKSIWNHLFNLTTVSKITVIITTHYIEEVRYSNKIGLMRNGRLLVEDDPICLMKVYQASLLEDVVLKICRKDKDHGVNELTNKSHNLNEVHVDNQPKFQSAWRKNLKSCCSEMKEICGTNGKFCMTCSDSKNDAANNLAVVQTSNATSNEKVILQDAASTTTTNVTNRKPKYKFLNSCRASFRRSIAYSQAEWINFLRNPVYMIILICLPPFQLMTTGGVVGVEPKNTPIGVVNYEIPNWKAGCFNQGHPIKKNDTCDLFQLSCGLIERLYSSDYTDPIEFTSVADALAAVERGDIKGYIEIPTNFSANAVERAVMKHFASNESIDGSKVSMHMDMSEYITMFVAVTDLYKSFERFIDETAAICDFNLKIVDFAFEFRDPVYGTLDGSIQTYVIPALIAGLLFEISFCVVPLILINDINQGTLHRANVAGLRFSEFMIGVLFIMASLTIIQVVMSYIFLEYGLNFHIQGSILVFTFICLLTTLCGGTFGLLMGMLLKDIMAIVICAIFLIPVLMMYAGTLQPVQSIPPQLRLIPWLLPTAAVVEPLRSVMNRGLSLTHPTVWPGVLEKT
ncbi:ABC transporter G family member 23 [Orchesella cincta]|uniref:ABC transporter G family member 23 n=1 Tax=Orchesella cincta TaxID=48709 RepID=A0A1D2NLQ9_ORCCI|nr:ABC transporter G family member 23 [Orchesella cincta]